MKQIAILLTCHNRKEKTLACLTALYNCTIPSGFKFTVFLVDDGCTDKTADAIKEFFPYVQIIQGDGNLYWNRGMRLSWSNAAAIGFDFYLWLNDDTCLFKYAITELLNVIVDKGDQVIVCGSTKSKVNNSITYSGYHDHVMVIPNGEVQTCNSFNGNIVLIPQYVYDKVGNLDNTFSHSIGDLDYGMRAVKKGINIYIAPNSLGNCENNPQDHLWCRPEKPFMVRLKFLYSPLGYCNPTEFFVFEKRHYGFLIALKHVFSIHLRLLFPAYWNKFKSWSK